MRLVDTDKIRWKSYPNDYGETNDDYVEKCDIDNMPTVDAVPVVRCKDCKYRDGTPGQPNIQCGNMHDDDFCSYGERKNGGAE
nr:MAG TPA: hypothetical protein [Caudoviricetes sp.]